MKKLLKIYCLKTIFCRGYYFFFKFKFSSFFPSNFPHLNCPPLFEFCHHQAYTSTLLLYEKLNDTHTPFYLSASFSFLHT